MLRAIIGAKGMGAVGRDARRVAAVEPQDSPWRSIAALLIAPGRPRATSPRVARLLEEAVQRAGQYLPSACVIPLSVLGLLASVEDDWVAVAEFTGHATQAAYDAGLVDYGTTALAVALQGLLAARGGDAETAGRALPDPEVFWRGSKRLHPWYRAAVRLVMARAHVAAGDAAGAQESISEVGPALARMPDAVLLIEHAERILAMCEAAGPGGGVALSKAELRVLRFLPTHLAFPQIAEELCVSKFTVKSHAISIYRKLDVTSRGAAVERAGSLA